ncbi:MAG: helix-hairpin-helix domain-containing protein [Aquincola sp.]|nr:helix-hairpin-helix domain-containing protein [Aquincola sp.]MDH4289267.1 helix-hairpin-helix domain-containing protein [Aquincola sp.]MDH5330720.1 helix-hairpin-helix domain-containing protein [Aquincola sp.]
MRRALGVATLVMLLSSAVTAWAATPVAAPPASSPAAIVEGMPAHPGAPLPTMRNRPRPVEHVVDINGASRKELMTLPGIGPAEADKIIKNRPYHTKADLVNKGVLQVGPFLSLKRQVVAIQPGVKAAGTKTQKNNSDGKPSSRANAVKAPSPTATAAAASGPKATP